MVHFSPAGLRLLDAFFSYNKHSTVFQPALFDVPANGAVRQMAFQGHSWRCIKKSEFVVEGFSQKIYVHDDSPYCVPACPGWLSVRKYAD